MAPLNLTCVVCGQSFQTTYRGPGRPRLFCSIECKKKRAAQQMQAVHKRRRTAQRAQRRKRRTCPTCQRRFYQAAGRPPATYCSKACAATARRIRNRAWMRHKRAQQKEALHSRLDEDEDAHAIARLVGDRAEQQHILRRYHRTIEALVTLSLQGAPYAYD